MTEKTQNKMPPRLYMKPGFLLFSSITFLSCYLGSVEGGIRNWSYLTLPIGCERKESNPTPPCVDIWTMASCVLLNFSLWARWALPHPAQVLVNNESLRLHFINLPKTLFLSNCMCVLVRFTVIQSCACPLHYKLAFVPVSVLLTVCCDGRLCVCVCVWLWLSSRHHQMTVTHGQWPLAFTFSILSHPGAKCYSAVGLKHYTKDSFYTEYMLYAVNSGGV